MLARSSLDFPFRHFHRALLLAFVFGILVLVMAALGCATSPRAVDSDDSIARDPAERDPSVSRSESAAPEGGAACGDRSCGVDEICVPQGFCSGVRPPTPEERGVTYECVAIPPSCAESPDCGCVGSVCRYGGCASISRGVVTCICA